MKLPNSFDSEIKKYLLKQYFLGEALNLDLIDGWHFFLVDRITLGFSNVTAGRLNNHYPKGLR